MKHQKPTATFITLDFTEPDYFRLDVAEAYKQLHLDCETEDTYTLKARLYNTLGYLTQPNHMLKDLQDVSPKYIEKHRGGKKTINALKKFVYEIGGWFFEDSENKEFIEGQLAKGKAFGEKYKNASFYAKAREPAIQEDQLNEELVFEKLRELTGDNFSLLFAGTKSSITARELGTDSIIYNMQPDYHFIGLLAFHNKKQLTLQGFNEPTIEKIEKELGQLGLQMGILEKAKQCVRDDLAVKNQPRPF